LTYKVLPKSLEKTRVSKGESRSSLLKRLERLVNKELPNKIDKGHLVGEGV
jgi:hypothetical protein